MPNDFKFNQIKKLSIDTKNCDSIGDEYDFNETFIKPLFSWKYKK